MPGIQPNDISTNWQLSCCWWLNCFFFSSCWSTCQSHFPRTKEEEEEGGYLYFKRLLFVRQGFQFQADISNMTRRLGYILCKSLARTRHFRSLFTLVRLSAPEFFPPSAVAVSFWFFLSYVQDRVTPIYPPIFPSRFPTFLFGRVSMSRNLIRTTNLTAKPQSRKIYRRGTSIAPNSFVINAYKYTGGESSTW